MNLRKLKFKFFRAAKDLVDPISNAIDIKLKQLTCFAQDCEEFGFYKVYHRNFKPGFLCRKHTSVALSRGWKLNKESVDESL